MQAYLRGLAAALLLFVSWAAGAAELEGAAKPVVPAVGVLPAGLPSLPVSPGLGALVLPTAAGEEILLGGPAVLPLETLLSLSPEAQAKMAVVVLRAAPLKPVSSAPGAHEIHFNAASAGSAIGGKAGDVIEEVLAGFSLKDLQTMPESGLVELSRRLAASRLAPSSAVTQSPQGAAVPAPAREHEEDADHDHVHERALNDPSAAKKVLAVNGTTLLLEVVGAVFTGSAALSAEAMHNAVDVGLMAALVLSSKLSRFGLDPKRTQAKISLLIAGVILATVVETSRQAMRHLLVPAAGAHPIAIVVALAGLANAAISLAILRKGGHGEGFRTLIAHFVADTVGALGVIAAGLLRLGLGWAWADPVTGFLIAGLVVWIGVPLMIRSVKTLLAK